jgi:hypothetical protein
MSNSREITLKYNGYPIPITITDNYKETINTIKKKLFLQDKDLKRTEIFYFDEDELENDLQEDDYDDAFSNEEIKVWGLRLKNEGDGGDEDEGKKDEGKNAISEEKVAEIKKDLEKKFQKRQKELISKFKKFANEKITANNKKYEEKIKKLQEKIKSLKEKNKKDLDEIKKIQEVSILKALNDVSEFAEKKIGEQFDAFNGEFSEKIGSEIQKTNIDINTKSNDLRKKISSMGDEKEKLDGVFNNTKDTVRDLFQSYSKMNKKK